eukprot:scaffold123502_cov16-Tisochrysis_lutea.AAC.1
MQLSHSVSEGKASLFRDIPANEGIPVRHLPAGPAAAAIAAHGAHPPRHAPPLAVLAAAAAAKGNSAAAAAGAAAAAPVHLQAVLSSPAESAGCAPRRQA